MLNNAFKIFLFCGWNFLWHRLLSCCTECYIAVGCLAPGQIRVESPVLIIMHPQTYSLQQLRVKSLAQGQLNQRFWEGGVWYMLPSHQKVRNGSSLDEGALPSTTYLMKDEPLLRLQPKVIHQDSLVHMVLKWFYDFSFPCLSKAKPAWVWFQNVRKTQKKAWYKPFLLS